VALFHETKAKPDALHALFYNAAQLYAQPHPLRSGSSSVVLLALIQPRARSLGIGGRLFSEKHGFPRISLGKRASRLRFGRISGCACGGMGAVLRPHGRRRASSRIAGRHPKP
jgi:hypothetical protein